MQSRFRIVCRAADLRSRYCNRPDVARFRPRVADLRNWRLRYRAAVGILDGERKAPHAVPRPARDRLRVRIDGV